MESTFNANLRRIRKDRSITQEQLAEAVGVSPQAVSKWELNSYPDAALLPKIAQKLDTSIDELFGLKNENISVYDRVLEHIKSFPAEQRIDEMFSIVRAFPLACCGAVKYEPIPEEILTSEYASHSRIIQPDGFIEMRNNADLQFAFLFPEPKCGYDKVLK